MAKKAEAVLDGIYSNVSHVLSPCNLRHLAREWLKEDVPTFDYGGFVVGEREETAVILMKSEGVLAGRPFADAVFQELDCSVQWLCEEGEEIQPVTIVARVTGKVRHLLLGERVSLNCLSRASGIATAARRVRRLVQSNGWKGEVAGTRKTTPGFRMVEKYALLVGGVSTHRYDLSAMIMLKDNHIWSAGSISQAVKDARVVGGFCTKVEVECRSLEEACQAAQAGCDVVMLDNFQPQAAAECARELKSSFPKLLVEVSGGITEESILQYCYPDVDILSMSCLTQGYATVDLSMKIVKEGRDPANPTVQLHEAQSNSE